LFKAVIDSGASRNMSSKRTIFESITTFPIDHNQPQAVMGNDSTSLPIAGYGMMNKIIHNKKIRIMGYYVPDLGVTLLSVKQHSKYQGCYFHAQSNEAMLAYPSFIIHPSTTNEIEVLFKSGKTDDSKPIDFDQQRALECPTKKQSNQTNHNITMYPKSMQQHVPSSQRTRFQETVQIQKLIDSAKIPTCSTKGSIGYDVYSTVDVTVQPGQIYKIPTGLATSLPSGMYLCIAPRSSQALKHTTIEGGLVDSDYRGEIKVLFKNHSASPIQITTSKPQLHNSYSKTQVLHFSN
jgi:deoxyuridine 5'-triphosphate nucleotidohydrolase